MSDGREERQQQEQRRQQEQEERLKDRHKYVDDRLDRFPIDPFQPERPES